MSANVNRGQFNNKRNKPFVVNKRKFGHNPHIDRFTQFRSNPEIFTTPLLDGEQNHLHLDLLSNKNERLGVFANGKGYFGRHFWAFEYIVVSLPMSFVEKNDFSTLEELREKKGEEFYQCTLGNLDEYTLRYVHPCFSTLEEVNGKLITTVISNFIDVGAYLLFMDAYIKPLNLAQLEKELAAGNISLDGYDLYSDVPMQIKYNYTEGRDANHELPFRPLQSSPLEVY